MANEFHQLPNPTNEPMASSTGYKRQNTLTYAIMTGLFTTAYNRFQPIHSIQLLYYRRFFFVSSDFLKKTMFF
jgi:hypothetical protein